MAPRPHGGGVPADDLSFVCPLCRGPLGGDRGGFTCGPCERTYPLHHGVPDFRVFPDPWLGFEEDRERAERVLEAMGTHDLPRLLERYWSLSEITPVELRRHFIRGALHGEAKARRLLGVLDGRASAGGGGARSMLEVGSGTGALLAAASERFPRVVGVDIAMRWLHVSRRRFMDRGLPVPPLVCACAERLPFPDGSFDVVVSAATLEVTKEPQQALTECARVVKAGGRVLLNTGNRFSLAVEPHVRLWGVGFLPRPWQLRYVRWRRGVSFSEIRPVSLRELRRLARAAFGRSEVLPADAADEAVAALPRAQRMQVALYRRLKRNRLIRPLLLRVAPEWDVLLTK